MEVEGDEKEGKEELEGRWDEREERRTHTHDRRIVRNGSCRSGSLLDSKILDILGSARGRRRTRKGNEGQS